MKKILFLLLVTSISFSQNADRKYESNSLKDNILNIVTSDGTYYFKIINNKIIETSFVPKGETYNENSHAVILKPKRENIFHIETSKKIDFYKGLVFFKNANNLFTVKGLLKNGKKIGIWEVLENGKLVKKNMNYQSKKFVKKPLTKDPTE